MRAGGDTIVASFVERHESHEGRSKERQTTAVFVTDAGATNGLA